MTREQLEAILSTGAEFGAFYGFTGASTQQMEEIKNLARRGLAAQEAVSRGRHVLNADDCCGDSFLIIETRPKLDALRRVAEAALEYRRASYGFDGVGFDAAVEYDRIEEALDDALTAVGMVP